MNARVMKARISACVLFVAASAAVAGGLDGKWTGSIDSPNGPVQVTYVFKAQGTHIIGTTVGPDGSPLTLKNVTLAGDKLSFSLDIDLGGGPTTFNYTGVVASDSIKLHTEFMGQPFDFTLKKAN
jgi:hypothetical protein